MTQAASAAIADLLRARLGGVESPVSLIGQLFDEEPVDLTTFVRDKKFLNHPRLSEIQYDAVRHLEQIYLPDLYPALVEEFGSYWNPVRFINFAYFEFGKGSGKDLLCRVANARAAYLLLCLKSPQAYFEMPESDEIQTLNVAASSSQAHRAYFRPLSTAVRHSSWFSDKLRADPTDMSQSIRLTKGIELISGHSMSDTLEGLNLIFAIADEISAFKTRDELERHAPSKQRESPRSAESILKMLRTSARTRFPKSFKLAAISYPRYKGDAIQQLRIRGQKDMAAKGEASHIYAIGPLATWEVNPRITGPEDFADDYEEDPDMARAMYECKPQLSQRRFFRDARAIYGAFAEQKKSLTIAYDWGIEEAGPGDDVGPGKIEGWLAKSTLGDHVQPYYGGNYVLHADMAVTGDRAGVAMSHVHTWELVSRLEGLAAERRPKVKVDFVGCWEADLAALAPDGTEAARQIQQRWFRQLVFSLIEKGFNIVQVTQDGWQSVDSLQQLELRGIEAAVLSVDRNTAAYDTVKELAEDGRLEGPYDELLVDELMALTRLPNGKIDHPAGFSKDMADAVAGSVHGAVLFGGDAGEEEVVNTVGMSNMFGTAGGQSSNSSSGPAMPDYLQAVGKLERPVGM